MGILIETLIYIVSMTGIFALFYTLTQDNIDFISSNKNGDRKVIDIYTYNIDDEGVQVLVKCIEDKEEICSMVDIVNVHQRFDK